ncbi:MAG: hypothetical protein RLZZ210_577 [Pseudomonadota bacterium]|jgi:dTDP-4-dehydrorhamnose reductase
MLSITQIQKLSNILQKNNLQNSSNSNISHTQNKCIYAHCNEDGVSKFKISNAILTKFQQDNDIDWIKQKPNYASMLTRDKTQIMFCNSHSWLG